MPKPVASNIKNRRAYVAQVDEVFAASAQMSQANMVSGQDGVRPRWCQTPTEKYSHKKLSMSQLGENKMTKN